MTLSWELSSEPSSFLQDSVKCRLGGQQKAAAAARKKQRKENVQVKETELQKVEVWLTALESPRITVSSEKNYLVEKTQLAGKMSTTGGKGKRRQDEKAVSHSADRSALGVTLPG